jgi:UDP-N-acetylmuramyl pentapeptide phosphotransferase/UDP-N-acetylglucosamine-1-phosphate transferase
VFGALFAGVLLTTIAAIRDSKWWLVFVAASAVTLADAYQEVARRLPFFGKSPLLTSTVAAQPLGQ